MINCKKKIAYETVLKKAWHEALSNIAKDMVYIRPDKKAVIKSQHYHPDKAMYFSTKSNNTLFDGIHRYTQKRYLRDMHRLGMIMPFYPDNDLHRSYFQINTAPIILFVQNFWLGQGLLFELSSEQALQSKSVDFDFETKQQELYRLLTDKFPYPQKVFPANHV